MATPRTLISPHYTLAELTRTDSRDPGILKAQRDPPANIFAHLVVTARNLLEPARVAGRLRVNSAYRCPALNASLRGASRKSMHMLGLAADVFPLDMGIVEAFERIAAAKIPALDQLIFEFGRWLHLGAARPGTKPRGQLLMIFSAGRYEPWNPTDERVKALREDA